MVKRRIFYGAATAAMALVVLLSVFLMSGGVGTTVQGATLLDATATPMPVMAVDSTSASSVAAAADTVIEQLYNAVSPSVVSINVVATRQGNGYFPGSTISGTGSGFVIDTAGHIVTNNHVVEGATDIEVNFVDGTIVRGTIVGTDANSDLAVIQVDLPAEQLHPVAFADSDALTIGQSVLAIGSPFGQRWTLTTGIISGLGREITGATNRPIQGVIQTDAAINPGNSGGPLLDSAGRVIGMNAAILSPSGAYAGIGFAVPIDSVNGIVPRLIRGEESDTPRLGALFAEDYLVRRLGREGALVLSVTPGGAADKAGLLATRRGDDGQILLGDLVVAIDGVPVAGTSDLYRVIDSHKKGDAVTLTIVRQDQKMDLEVTLNSTA